MPAPIVLFCYNRPEHTRKALESLAANEESGRSVLYIYADGPKTNASAEDLNKIASARAVIREKQWCAQVHIVEANQNKGLANSVIEGVTDIVNRYGKVIVLEDDLVTAPTFLAYMNKALDTYAGDKNVFQISAHMFPLAALKPNQSAFFLPIATSWGWATWKRAWEKFDTVATGYSELKLNKKLRNEFNFNNSYPYSEMLLNQMETKKIDSWAIKWWWTIFKNDGLVLYPDKSLVLNIGWDGSGRHSPNQNPFHELNQVKAYRITNFPCEIVPDRSISAELQQYFRSTFPPLNKKTSGSKLKSFFQSIIKRTRI